MSTGMVWIAALSLWAIASPNSVASQPSLVPFRVIARGSRSRVEEPLQLVARTQGSWQMIWTHHAADLPMPEVDLGREMVIALFAGPRPAGEDAIDVVDVRTAGRDLVVRYRGVRTRDTSPTSQPAATAPFEIIAVPATTAYVRFVQVQDAR